jgi:CHAT domain-containing protein
MSGNVKGPLVYAVVLSILSLFSPVTLAQKPALDPIRSSYQQTLTTYEQELTEARKQDASGRWQEIDILNRAALAHRYFGNNRQSLILLEEALQIARAIPDRAREEGVIRELATTHNNLGDDKGINFLQRQLQQARQDKNRQNEALFLKLLGFAYSQLSNPVAQIEALENYLKLVPPQDQNKTEIQLEMSLLVFAYEQLKEFSQQHKWLQRQLEIARELKDPTLEYNTLVSLGFMYRGQKQYTQALDILQNLTKLPLDEQYQVLSLQFLGKLYAEMRQPAKAVESFQSGIKIARRTNNQLMAGMLLKSLGRTEFLAGRYEQAQTYQKQSIIAFQTFYGQNKGSLSEAQTLVELALTLSRTGQWGEAERLLRQSQTIAQKDLQAIFANQSLLNMSFDELKLPLFEVTLDSYRLLQQALIAQNQPEAALEMTEKGRAKAFTQLLATRLGITKPLSQPDPIPLTLAQMRQVAKQQNTTLVEYAVVVDDLKIVDFYLDGEAPQPSSLFIWVIQPSGKVTFRRSDLKPLQQQNLPLTKLVQNARKALGAVGRVSSVLPSEADLPPDPNTQGLKRLHDLLIAPIEDLLPADPQARVTFIPQDVLFLAPFAALQDSQGRYLIQKHTISLAPSIQTLELIQQQSNARSRSTGLNMTNALIVGNPVMPSLKSKPNSPAEQLSPLPGSELEAQAISKRLNSHPLLGKQATEAAVTKRMSQASLIHLATHGILDNLQGLQSSLALAPINPTITGEDGFLTAREVMKLELQADLVVLSACDTGRGVINGDGVIGLSRSFMAAGAPSVVVSLWAVPDAPIAELMTTFYKNLELRMDKAQALRQAMLITMKQHPKPLDWAGFMLLGLAD